jgi:flagellar hook assembly protein FlgD
VIRLPVATFVALGAATVGAFFLTQALKVTTPLINGLPAPVPSTINPVNGGRCLLRNPKGVRVPVSFKRMKVSFYLQNRGDVVYVYILDEGRVIRTLPGSGRYLRTFKRREFVWNGRESDGRIAPDGSYDIQVSLAQQGRKLLIAKPTGAVEPVTVQTHPPALVVTGVAPRVVAVPGRSVITIHYSGNQGLRPQIQIVRVGGSGARPQVIKRYAATSKGGMSAWNGTLQGGAPAPPGTYLIGLRLSPDKTCNTVQSALTPAAAPQAVVTVR